MSISDILMIKVCLSKAKILMGQVLVERDAAVANGKSIFLLFFAV